MKNSASIKICLSAIKLLYLACTLILLPLQSNAQTNTLPFKVPSDFRVLPETALIETSKGSFEIKFYRDTAPITVANFTNHSLKEFYNGLSFHRYTPGYVLQGGDPDGNGKGGPNYTIPPEFSHIRHRKGTIGMARLPGERNPERHSNGSQFYICLTDAPHLDGLYTVFAEVVNGLEVVEQLRAGDKILRVRLPKNYKGQALER